MNKRLTYDVHGGDGITIQTSEEEEEEEEEEKETHQYYWMMLRRIQTVDYLNESQASNIGFSVKVFF